MGCLNNLRRICSAIIYRTILAIANFFHRLRNHFNSRSTDILEEEMIFESDSEQPLIGQKNSPPPDSSQRKSLENTFGMTSSGEYKWK